MLDQFDEYLRHRRQPGNQQAIADILVWLVHCLKRRDGTRFRGGIPGTGLPQHDIRASLEQEAIFIVVPDRKAVLAYIHFWSGTILSVKSVIFPVKNDAFCIKKFIFVNKLSARGTACHSRSVASIGANGRSAIPCPLSRLDRI
jgi:hypothetical protein